MMRRNRILNIGIAVGNSGWEWGSQLKYDKFHKYLACEIGRPFWNDTTEFRGLRPSVWRAHMLLEIA